MNNRVEFKMELKGNEVSNMIWSKVFSSVCFRVFVIILLIGISASNLLLWSDKGNYSQYKDLLEDIGFLSTTILIVIFIFIAGYAKFIKDIYNKIFTNATFVIDDEGFAYKTDTTNYYRKWGGFRDINETNKYIFLRSTGAGNHVIFKNLLSEEELTTTKNILANVEISKNLSNIENKQNEKKRKSYKGLKILIGMFVFIVLIVSLFFTFYITQRLSSKAFKAEKVWTAAFSGNVEFVYNNTTEDFKRRVALEEIQKAIGDAKSQIVNFKEYKLEGVSSAFSSTTGEPTKRMSNIHSIIYGKDSMVFIESCFHKIDNDWLLNSFNIVIPKLKQHPFISEDDEWLLDDTFNGYYYEHLLKRPDISVFDD